MPSRPARRPLLATLLALAALQLASWTFVTGQWRGAAPQQLAARTAAAVAAGLPETLVSDAPPSLAAVEQIVASSPLVLFMKGTPMAPRCGFSARAVGLLRELEVPYRAVDVLDEVRNPGVREAVKVFGGWPTIPQLYADGELLGGVDIMSDLVASGDLQQRFGKDARGVSVAQSGTAATVTAMYGVDDPRRPIATAMTAALRARFQLAHLEIKDESQTHVGHEAVAATATADGPETHLRFDIVSDDFEGLAQLQRQKLVFDALSTLTPRVHALSLSTRTSSEASAGSSASDS